MPTVVPLALCAASPDEVRSPCHLSLCSSPASPLLALLAGKSYSMSLSMSVSITHSVSEAASRWVTTWAGHRGTSFAINEMFGQGQRPPPLSLSFLVYRTRLLNEVRPWSFQAPSVTFCSPLPIFQVSHTTPTMKKHPSGVCLPGRLKQGPRPLIFLGDLKGKNMIQIRKEGS